MHIGQLRESNIFLLSEYQTSKFKYGDEFLMTILTFIDFRLLEQPFRTTCFSETFHNVKAEFEMAKNFLMFLNYNKNFALFIMKKNFHSRTFSLALKAQFIS